MGSQGLQELLQQRSGSWNLKRSLLIKEKQTSQSPFSTYEKMPRSGFTEIIPLMHSSGLWGQYPVLSHPESPRVHHPLGGGAGGVVL